MSENFEKSDETIQEEKEEDRGTGEEVQIPSSGRLSNVNYDSDDDDDEEELTSRQKFRKRFWDFYETNEFLILVVIAICLARAYPPLGAEYLKPKITAGWIAVILIFLMAGLALRTEEFVKAFQQIYFNAFVQLFNFGFISVCVFGFSRLMVTLGAISQELGNGMAICGCLPITVNMCVVLTKASGGDEAAAIFNTAFANMIGIFISPLLIVLYIGVEGGIDTKKTFLELSLKVLLPLFVGQVLQKTSKLVVRFVKKFKKYFLRGQEYCLVFILYTTFCKTFAGNKRTKITQILWMILFQFILLMFFTTLAWYSLKFLFPVKPKLRVMGLFGCTHKTIAVGVPLITSIYATSPNLGVYTLPLLIWYPMQLIIGTCLLSNLKLFLESERKRLEGEEETNSDDIESASDGEHAIIDDGLVDKDNKHNKLQEPSFTVAGDADDNDREGVDSIEAGAETGLVDVETGAKD